MTKNDTRMRRAHFVWMILMMSASALFAASDGVLKGRVTDARTQEPLVGVTVIIKELPGRGASSDPDGNYSIALPAGSYTVAASYVSYAAIEITNVEVSGAVTTTLDIDLRETSHELGEVMVMARRDMEAEKALMLERRQASIAVENLGAKEMSAKGLSTVADGIKKITGISMEGGGKIYVRGLGERYSMSSLNGFPVASPNPDSKLIPLTLFPTSIVRNVSVSKVYRASAPGDYSGAHINVDTKENIGKDYLTLSLSVGGRTGALFTDFYTSDKQGAELPWLGIGDGLRLDRAIRQMTVDDFGQWQRTQQPFSTGFSIAKQVALPTVGAELGASKTWQVGGRKLGWLLAAGFSNSRSVHRNASISTLNAQGVERDRFDYDKYTYGTTATLLTQADYQLGRADRITLNAMLINNTEDSYTRREGADAEGVELVGSNSLYRTGRLFNSQLAGSHELMRNRLYTDWQASYGHTISDEPDRRQVMFARRADGSLSLFKLNRQETMRYFGELTETESNADVKLKLMLPGGTDTQANFVRVGTAARRKSRDFYSANFYYNLKNIDPPIADVYDTDRYLSHHHVADGTIAIDKNSLPRNRYTARSDVYAGFVELEYHPLRRLHLSVGLRYERFDQQVRYWTDAADGRLARLVTDDLFPAINLKYAVSPNRNLRAALSRTVTRPSFLEMAPFEYKESYGGATIRGYGDIRNGYNYNADLRYEYFDGFGDMYSIGVYYKYLFTPIERVQVYKGADDGFEWFGGTVNARYLVSTHSEDDSFDWTDGWTGKGQFWVAVQDRAIPGDCLIEADNREDNFDNTPRSHPVLANLTLVGNGDTTTHKRGIRLRAGTAVTLSNALVTGKPNALTIATDQTAATFADGTSSVEYVRTDGAFVYEKVADLALAARPGNAIRQAVTLSGGFVGTVDGGKALPSDGFFTPAAYLGAVQPSADWTAGWTLR